MDYTKDSAITDYKEFDEIYNEWVKNVGGIKNVKLREFHCCILSINCLTNKNLHLKNFLDLSYCLLFHSILMNIGLQKSDSVILNLVLFLHLLHCFILFLFL